MTPPAEEEVVRKIPFPGLTCCAVSLDGKILLLAGRDINLYNFETGREIQTFGPFPSGNAAAPFAICGVQALIRLYCDFQR